ncbi:MAG: CoA transferase, partial [Dehalococcoidia bacterium]
MPALEGMRVLDMTQYEAGTTCTQYLGWLGADVVKIEGPAGDPGRGLGRVATDTQYFMNYNGNKRSIVLNLKDERGRQALLDLAPHFDVFVENYGPGIMESLGIAEDALREVNPRLIYARIKGFGLSGPYSDYPAYDWVAQAAAGTFSVTGEPGGPPLITGATVGDTGTGIQTALGIVAAYVERQRTGQGQFIEVSMQECATMFMRTLALDQWGETPAPRSGGRRGRAGGGMYRCKGDGPNDYVFIFPSTSQMWDALCTTIGRDDLLSDPRFATVEARAEHLDDIAAVLTEWTMQRDKREAMRTLAAAGIPCSYVADSLDLFTDEHLQSRDFIQTVEHPENGTVRLMRNPLRMPGAA